MFGGRGFGFILDWGRTLLPIGRIEVSVLHSLACLVVSSDPWTDLVMLLSDSSYSLHHTVASYTVVLIARLSLTLTLLRI